MSVCLWLRATAPRGLTLFSLEMAELLTPIQLLSHRLSGGVQLSRTEIAALGAIAGPPRSFARGELIVEEGDTSPLIWLTGLGWALRQKMLSDGRRQIIAIMLPGELTEKGPEMPFGSPETIVAATDLTAQSIDRQQLAEVAATYPRILQAMFFEELTRHAITREWVLPLGQRTAEERVAYLIYETYARLNAMGLVSGSAFSIPLLQSELADIVGMSTVHFNRTLQRLRARKLVDWAGQKVELPDPEALASLARFSKHLARTAQAFGRRAAVLKRERSDDLSAWASQT